MESVFLDDDNWVKCSFEFSLEKLDIDDPVLVDVEGITENVTTVKLIIYLPAYQKYENKNAENIATKIMQHCFIYLMSPNCPIISVFDDERFGINDMLRKILREKNKELR